ncbi:MAG: hypothetical protein K2O05_02020, partial [Anaeroplasmataceae bacterium]|nr:hypothetical protein [Anaeroplasmataceae bacterium]
CRSGILPKTITKLIKGEANITFDIANNLASFFGNSVDFWINLQTRYNSYLLECENEKKLEEEWEIFKMFDASFLKNECQIDVNNMPKEDIITAMKQCFMVNSLNHLKTPDMFAFCRTSVKKDLNEKQIILRNAWISYAMFKSKDMECCQFDAKVLQSKINEIRNLTFEESSVFFPKLKVLLAECGIKFLNLPYLAGSNISGVTRWLANEKTILLAINDYGKDADKFWFNLFHELGHAIQNKKRHLTISFIKDQIMDQDEIDANKFAEDNLIDPKKYYDFIDEKDFSIEAIEHFSKNIGIASFIVIGRLQNDKIINWNKYNEYKTHYNFI